MKRIVIIGGGYSGSMTAVNLARLGAGPLEIVVVNSGRPLARGIAYSTRNGHHLLNVVARNMSALADQPGHFVEWLQTRSEYYEEPVARLREKFVPRRIYGDYLSSLLLAYSKVAAEKEVRIETVPAEAVDLLSHGATLTVVLSNGRSLEADKVLLATGNQAPSHLRIPGLSPDHPRYFQNPWVNWEAALKDPTENVLLAGTGLTMIDAFISLRDLDWKGKIYAISRNGLLPMAHFKGVEYPDLVDDDASAVNFKRIFGAFKKHLRRARAEGINPAILVDKLRPFTQRIWQNFSALEKRRFNRHFRSRWNVTRHRIPQSISQQLLEAVAAHRLEIVKGRFLDFRDCGDQFVLSVKTPSGIKRIEGGALINCTGPKESYAAEPTPLFAKLFERGLVQADELDMGVKVGPDFAVQGADGRCEGKLYAIGSLLKGTLWETTAVPELRSQAFRMAEILSKQLSGRNLGAISEVVEPVLEYEI